MQPSLSLVRPERVERHTALTSHSRQHTLSLQITLEIRVQNSTTRRHILIHQVHRRDGLTRTIRTHDQPMLQVLEMSTNNLPSTLLPPRNHVIYDNTHLQHRSIRRIRNKLLLRHTTTHLLPCSRSRLIQVPTHTQLHRRTMSHSIQRPQNDP